MQESSRLVFVSVKGAQPRRKVAIPVPDSFTFDDFTEKVKQKLKLLSVGSICHLSTGEILTSVDELQDIDELLVEEAPLQSRNPNTASAPFPKQDGIHASSSAEINIEVPDRASSSVGVASAATLRGSQPSRASAAANMPRNEDDEDVQMKYKKRNTGIIRRLQRIFPNWLSPGLPVSSREVTDIRGYRARRWMDPRNYLVIFAVLACVATLMLLTSRLAVA
uniref:Uncharacterized protein n=1 Tax=Tetraselmis chuii TaxID=63592 RepID=A0A7S1SZJ8_9CHLO|mmetsp:Transcript_37821/g.67820  ORF Transcript_37821/g.67820 Transcript_37821/m.67820 type:complete len:222 (+) Transcript_37821:289-954(+)|eukprot:CAMPEP_0177769842 /NCGR_PEP_ID=MMETSP0491_2-20121128/10572_1 /TAXON_ID=63592 /ORGANISM="Tetraselmis chuii, Strain PLY429" /LENGTH=221 /DNA_ID=CAMNT_0019286947 /DNA_START=167 /DNA_END=832 /DNA_ORIENTATION=+